MYKNYRYYNAGDNEFHRWGRKAQAKVEAYMTANEAGFYSIPADGGKYWTIGTSEGQYGAFAKFGDVILSVNRAGNVWAKVGTPKAKVFLEMCRKLVDDMKAYGHSNATDEEEDEDEEAVERAERREKAMKTASEISRQLKAVKSALGLK